MHKLIISLICCLLPVFASAESVSEPKHRAATDTEVSTPSSQAGDDKVKQIEEHANILPNAPDRHVVVKGDTLWDISAMSFKDPWKWPKIWNLNKDTIKDSHWIYPGDVIVLDRSTGTLRIGEATQSSSPPVTNVVRLSPKAHEAKGAHDAIPSIPIADIAPFLSQPLVIESNNLSSAPIVVGTYEQRVILGNNDIAYVKGLSEGRGRHWQVYRPGKTFQNPDSKEILGYEAIYLGDADIENLAELSTIRITHSIQEIGLGDRLTQTSGSFTSNFVPHAPEKLIDARVISIYGGVSQAGQNTVITLNKGLRDGLEDGHVLALYHKGATLTEAGKGLFAKDKHTDLPDTRFGLLFVFRTFEKVAYALVMGTTLPVEIMDRVRNP